MFERVKALVNALLGNEAQDFNEVMIVETDTDFIPLHISLTHEKERNIGHKWPVEMDEFLFQKSALNWETFKNNFYIQLDSFTLSYGYKIKSCID